MPIGVFGTVWAYLSLHEIATTRRAKIDWLGNATFALGAGLLLVAITYGIQPYGGSATGWTNPWVLGGLTLGVVLLVLFCYIENRIPEPMFDMRLFRSGPSRPATWPPCSARSPAAACSSCWSIWLAGIWLPLHGYNYVDNPLWAGIYMLPLTAGFLIAGPISGWLSDRYGQRLFATTGLLVATCAFIGLMLLPIVFPYWVFGTLIFLNGVGSGLFASPNTSAIMSSVPAYRRGSASGMRSTFQNSGMALSIGIFFSLIVASLANTLPRTLTGAAAAACDWRSSTGGSLHPRQRPRGAPGHRARCRSVPHQPDRRARRTVQGGGILHAGQTISRTSSRPHPIAW